MTREHVPVLAGEAIELTNPRPDELVVDCTFGAGGHARLLAERIGPGGEIVCIDRDPAAADRHRQFAGEVSGATRLLNSDFASALAELAAAGLRADVVLFDLGLSSPQVDTLERGFSYVYDAPLDMRMDPARELSAAAIVRDWPVDDLIRLFDRYGEEKYAKPIAREIGRRREQAPIETTNQLVEAIISAIPTPARFGAGHPAKRVFQALRIAVNDELGQLEAALPLAWGLLKPGGRLAAISFHSLEDRIVKQFLVGLATGCICPPEFPICTCGHTPEAELLTRRAVAPTDGEIAENPRAKSGRLRVARRIDGLDEADRNDKPIRGGGR